jgi:hypothetical protein
MLVKWSNAKRINGSVEGIVGLAYEYWKYASPKLGNVVSQHVEIPAGVAGADEVRRGERVQKRGRDNKEKQPAA